MTNQKDKHLDANHIEAWLDAYHVDLSAIRLDRLENAILDEIDTMQIDLFTLPTWRESLAPLSVVGLMTMVLVMVTGTLAPLPAGTEASILLGNPLMGWSY